MPAGSRSTAKQIWSRLRPDQDRTVARALQIANVTLAEFVRDATVARAQEIILQHAIAGSEQSA